MAIENKQRGFVLLIAVIFMTVMLTFGLTLGSLGYKQQVLASSAIESQYAFYAADTALECALYADQQQNIFDHTSHSASAHPSTITCDSASATELSYSYDTTQLIVKERIMLDSGKHCADITVYKPPPNSGKETHLFSQGYNVSCATVANSGDARVVSRGLRASF